MALPKNFPTSPYAVLNPDARWYPGDEQIDGMKIGHLLPPLVQELREQVKGWRDRGYEGAADTSRALLNWWFGEQHLLTGADGVAREFRYYFAQREAVETVVYLYDAVKARDKYDLMRLNASGAVSANMFDESWRRYVIKMATGSGKTKVLGLVLAWSYFHKTYEPGSELARNFLMIAPNIIVLDRLRADFDGLRIFSADPVLPENGYGGRNWRDDFQLTVHIQDAVRVVRPTGNIFLTNIHRVYAGDDAPSSPDDENSTNYFLGKRPTGATTDSKVDLGAIVRDVDELVVLNDEAHHIHDSGLAWFKSIEDIHNQLLQKGGSLALQVDTTATPRHEHGAIFVQTVADYPLVEAISQNIVKHPVLPDQDSRDKLKENQSANYAQRYADYLDLGVVEWRKAEAQHRKLGKKSILFVMTDDTRNCDDVAAYLEQRFPDLEGAVLTIHTKRNGEIAETGSGRSREELELLRRQANEIDRIESPYKAIVSVLVLKEGWDVRNVTTIVGLRAYTARSNILPEQTLGRGLRRMYPDDDAEEFISVIGTDAFMEFVETIQKEGVVLERREMGEGAGSKTPLIIEVDKDNENKNIAALDIEIPLLSPRMYRDYANLESLDVRIPVDHKIPWKRFGEEAQRAIVFKDIASGEVAHITMLDAAGLMDYRNVIAYFARTVMRELRLASGYEILYGKLKDFVQNELFDRPVLLEDPETLRNLAEPAATKTVIDTFRKAINELTVQDMGDTGVRNVMKLRDTRPFIAKNQKYVIPEKSVFNRMVGDSGLELRFARFLENCPDVASWAKNHLAVDFKLDYTNAEGAIANYYPDFIVKMDNGSIVIVETKGLEDSNVPLKMARLRRWCYDASQHQREVIYDFVFVDQDSFYKYGHKSFAGIVASFRKYKHD